MRPSLTFVHKVWEVYFMENGTVKSFDETKGQGWIVPTDGTKELFVHQRNILGDDVSSLPINAKVTYESRSNDRGLEAMKVSLIK
jgi:cold shock protein